LRAARAGDAVTQLASTAQLPGQFTTGGSGSVRDAGAGAGTASDTPSDVSQFADQEPGTPGESRVARPGGDDDR